MMSNSKFFSIVLVLLLASTIVLTGCMYAVAAEKGEAKVYDMGSQINVNGSIIVGDDTPIAQTELQKKFGTMYDISENGKSITVITQEYLNEYWDSNYDKEVIHSLTTEEVYFIIQDSIRIYMQYDKVILTEFGSVSSIMQVAERFPLVRGQEVCRPITSYLDRDKVEVDIHTIIMYRLKALSSPKAFFTGADAICFVGGNPASYDGMYPESVFYIPGYSANTDRDYILSIMGGSTNFTDLKRFTDLFEISEFGGIGINFSSIANGSTTKVFPTEDIHKIPVPDGFDTNKDDTSNNPNVDKNNTPEAEENNTPYFLVDIKGGSCALMSSNGAEVEAVGTYVREGDAHILYFDGDFQYVFYYDEGVGYEYTKAESNPIAGFEFDSGQMFCLEDSQLIPCKE